MPHMVDVSPILPNQAFSFNKVLLQVLEGNRYVSIKVLYAVSPNYLIKAFP